MLFSSALFLFIFLPAMLIVYFFTPRLLKNTWLILGSLVFFAWGGVGYSVILILSILFNYVTGILIGRHQDSTWGKIFLITGVAVNLILLGTFKYANFIVTNINSLIVASGHTALVNPEIALPIGISFYTFHSLSYLVDIYRRDALAQRNPANLMLYISFFPQLVAGPIIRYHEISGQLTSRTHSIEKFSYGVERFVIGLAKKVLLANTFALVADKTFASDLTQLSALNAWIGILSYTFQIYFDFSGYSDMAIGLARMFGFEFPENFNFPYVAKSIKEFWRRWHISLSTWFRDYLYIPLGGNRLSSQRTYINLFIVFFATGFWHGASWTFVVWGLYHGSFLVLERAGLEKKLHKVPSIFSNLYTFIVVLMGWVLFRADSFSQAEEYYAALFRFEFPLPELAFFKLNTTRDYCIALVIAILGSFGFFIRLQNFIRPMIRQRSYYLNASYDFLYGSFLLSLLILSTMYLISGTYNPFIYYRF